MNSVNRFLLALLFALGISNPAGAAQVRQVDGEPVLGAKAEPIVAFRATGAPPVRLVMEPLDLMRIAKVQTRNRQQGPTQIGIGRDIGEASAPLPTLRWTKAGSGSVARIVVESPDALGLRVGLRFASIPNSLELRVAGSLLPGRVVHAPGTSIARQFKAARTYWTPTTDGDVQTIELYVPSGVDPRSLRVAVTSVSHLLTNRLEGFSLAKAIGESGACNVDVVCRVATLGQNFVNTKNSVARMVFLVSDDAFSCTGTLLADTDTSTQLPYFWTADHCIGSDEVAATLETHWNFEATSCGGGVSAPVTVRTGGADLLYSDHDNPDTTSVEGTDAALLRLNDSPPAGAYFSGWNANVLPDGSNVLAVHHPKGDLKKSSLGAKVAQDTFKHYVGWTSGTTERGSSGSGLFTNTGTGGGYELRGGLYGGRASCANTGNLSDNNNRDWYSRLDMVYDEVDQWLAATPTTPGPTRDYTGAWFMPSESGWGFTAFQYNNDDQVLFILFFIYDSNGVAKWYELGGGWSGPDVRSGEVFQSNANQPWSTSFNPALRTFTPVGTATLTFTSDTTANLVFTVNGVTRNVAVQKL